MRARISVAVVLFVGFVISACDQGAPTDPARGPAARAAILDGSAGGNAHFYFLPPVVKKASFSGVFNPNISPTVEICADTQQDGFGHCTTLIARFKRHAAPGEEVEPIAVSLKGEHYAINFRTTQYTIPQDVPFRLVVLAGDFQLGYVDLIRNGKNFRNQTTGELLNRIVDGTVPISFRIENGAFCANSSVECLETSVGPAGGTFTIERNDGTKPAGTQFPAGALNETVTLIIERYLGECLPTDAPQYQGCYRFRTEPHIDNFELPATVGVCLFDAAAQPLYDSGQLRLWKWSEKAGDAILELERVTIDYLECPTTTQIGMRGGSPIMMGAARATAMLLKPLASLLMPREAHAFGIYEGGKLINFSRIGWVRPLAVEIKSGNEQTGKAGAPLAAPLSMRVINKYGTVSQGVAGRALTFTPSGDGSANPSAAFTDALGDASTSWTLATTPGANSLLARALTSRPIAPVPYEAEAVFTANGHALSLWWEPTIGTTFEYQGTQTNGLAPVVALSLTGGAHITTLPTTEITDSYQFALEIAQLQQGVSYRLAVMVAGIEMGHVDVTLDGTKLRMSDTGRQVASLDQVTTLRIKFKLLQ